MDQLASRIKELPVEMITEILNNLKPKFYVVYEDWTENISWYTTFEDALAWFIWNLQYTDNLIQLGNCEVSQSLY